MPEIVMRPSQHDAYILRLMAKSAVIEGHSCGYMLLHRAKELHYVSPRTVDELRKHGWIEGGHELGEVRRMYFISFAGEMAIRPRPAPPRRMSRAQVARFLSPRGFYAAV